DWHTPIITPILISTPRSPRTADAFVLPSRPTSPAAPLFFPMIRRPRRSTLSLHDALPISPPVSFVPPSTTPAITSMCISGHPSVDRKSTRLNSSHVSISYAVFCLKKKKADIRPPRGGRECPRAGRLNELDKRCADTWSDVL